jgi:hypothetical protein
VEGRTGDASAGPAADLKATPAANGPVDPAGAAAGVAPAAAAVLEGGGGSSMAIKPQAFKVLVGRGHPEFSSNRQQVQHGAGAGCHGRRNKMTCPPAMTASFQHVLIAGCAKRLECCAMH